jgi:hypothetical protein
MSKQLIQITTCDLDKDVFMKMFLAVLSALPLAACVTMSGSYKVTATGKDGSPLPVTMDVQGSNIYTARNAICSAYPGATVSIVEATAGTELSSESPYACK